MDFNRGSLDQTGESSSLDRASNEDSSDLELLTGLMGMQDRRLPSPNCFLHLLPSRGASSCKVGRIKFPIKSAFMSPREPEIRTTNFIHRHRIKRPVLAPLLSAFCDYVRLSDLIFPILQHNVGLLNLRALVVEND